MIARGRAAQRELILKLRPEKCIAVEFTPWAVAWVRTSASATNGRDILTETAIVDYLHSYQ